MNDRPPVPEWERPEEPEGPLSDPPETLWSAAFIVLAIGMLFRVQHWPLSNALLITAWALILATMIWRGLQGTAIGPPMIVRDLFTLALFSSLIMFLLHLPGLLFAISVLVMTAILRLGYARRGRGMAPGRTPWYFNLCAVLVLAGVVFRIQHWPGSIVLLIVGLVGLAFWLFTSGASEEH